MPFSTAFFAFRAFPLALVLEGQGLLSLSALLHEKTVSFFNFQFSHITLETSSHILLMRQAFRACLWASWSPVPWSFLSSHPALYMFTFTDSSFIPILALLWLPICCVHKFSNLSPPVITFTCPCTLPRTQMRLWVPSSFSPASST